ncbi:MAG: methylaspartate ammonia-lyase, partial [Lentisphaeria bacterium]|nr:methylaspartate ammonia-lyase [Lentisphaeria bacterium]
MKIKNVFYSAGLTGFFFDDQRAIKRGAPHDGFIYTGDPVTPGFSRIRQAGESISIIIELENGRLAWGDAAAVQYSGAGGRDPLMLAGNYIPLLERSITPMLVGMELDGFRKN